MSNKSKILIGCLILLLVTSIGYALFSETISINGTATANATFDMKVSSARVVTEVGSKGATAVPSQDGNSLVITVPKLEYPGAYVDIDYEITNNGTVDAVYKNYSITGETEKIEAKFRLDNFYYLKGETKNNHIRIFWKNDTKVATNEKTTIVINYGFEQVGDHSDLCKKTEMFLDDFNKTLNNHDKFERIYDFNGDNAINSTDLSLIFSILPKDCN